MSTIRVGRHKLWESVALAILAQATGSTVVGYMGIGIQYDLWQLVNNGWSDAPNYEADGILDRVYRDLEDSKKDEPYPVVLARELGLSLLPRGDIGVKVPLDLRLKLPGTVGTPLYRNAIIVAPFGLRRDLELPLVVWRHIARFLRSYGRPVLLLGDKNARMDIATFSEGDLLGRQPLATILATIAASEVVIGVPNEWTWLAGSMNAKIGLFYPDNVPQRRWYWMASNRTARGVFTPSNVQTPIILTTIRKLLEVL